MATGRQESDQSFSILVPPTRFSVTWYPYCEAARTACRTADIKVAVPSVRPEKPTQPTQLRKTCWACDAAAPPLYCSWCHTALYCNKVCQYKDAGLHRRRCAEKDFVTYNSGPYPTAAIDLPFEVVQYTSS